jgi:SAM-dependent methyltransferase
VTDSDVATNSEQEYKERQRKMWASGDWPAIAPTIQEAADAVVAEIGVAEGHDVLDVATGNGNAAITAALRGARVTGLDLVPELLESARERADEAGVRVDWVEGDAEHLPFEDGSFDRVTSIFGVIFAFDHPRAAAELVRVARPGAVIGVTGWTREGMFGKVPEVVQAYLPEPPPPERDPHAWGDVEHVRGLFSRPELEVPSERRTLDVVFDSSEEWVDYQADKAGPLVGARLMLQEQGTWGEARAALIELYERYNQADDGTLRAPVEYLLTTVKVSRDG